jgi:hypothetical protein
MTRSNVKERVERMAAAFLSGKQYAAGVRKVDAR